MKRIFIYTLTSIMVFFSISFLTVLNDIYSPLFSLEPARVLSIGFPFSYYSDFQIADDGSLNAGWNLKNLLADCFLTWLSVLLIAFLSRKYFKK